MRIIISCPFASRTVRRRGEDREREDYTFSIRRYVGIILLYLQAVEETDDNRALFITVGLNGLGHRTTTIIIICTIYYCIVLSAVDGALPRAGP